MESTKERFGDERRVVRSGMRFADVVVPAEWASETLVHAEFSGDGAGVSPLTWAQRVMWRSIARNGSNHAFLHLRRTVPVSARAGAEVPAVARAVGALVGRHGSLRTRVRVVDGAPRQETAAAGVLPLLVCVGAQDGAGAARDAAGRLGDVAFDHAAEWPLRVALVTVADRVRQVVVVFSHSTVDAHAAETVLRELRLIMLRGGLPTPAGPQSVDVARWQHDADRGRSARSIGHWLREWDRLPTPPLPAAGPGLTPLTPPWRRGVLVSSAVDTATRLIAARHRVSGSAVLLAGVAAMATGRHERDRCGLFRWPTIGFAPSTRMPSPISVRSVSACWICPVAPISGSCCPGCGAPPWTGCGTRITTRSRFGTHSRNGGSTRRRRSHRTTTSTTSGCRSAASTGCRR